MRRPRSIVARIEALEARRAVAERVTPEQARERLAERIAALREAHARGETLPPSPKQPWTTSHQILADRIARLCAARQEAQ